MGIFICSQELAEYEKVADHVKVTQRGTVLTTVLKEPFIASPLGLNVYDLH